MPGFWTTKAQREWLWKQVPIYRRHQAVGTFADFWEALYPAWFALWPEEICPKTGRSTKTRLKQWMNNATKGGKRSKGKGIVTDVVLKRNGKAGKFGRKKRALSRGQCWTKLYYDDAMAARFAAHWETFLATNPDKTTHRATECARWCDEMRKNAPEDEAAAVEALWQAERESGRKKICPTQYRGQYSQDQLKTWDHAIQHLPYAGVDLLREILSQTGLVGTLMIGGPMPSLGGDIGMITVGLQAGEQEETFKTWYKNHSNLEMEYTRYLQHIFPASELPKRALAYTHSSSRNPTPGNAPESSRPMFSLDEVEARAAVFAEWSDRALQETGAKKWLSMSMEERRAYVHQFREKAEAQAAAETLQPDNSVMADAVRQAFVGDAKEGVETGVGDSDEYSEPDEDWEEESDKESEKESDEDSDEDSDEELFEEAGGRGYPSRSLRKVTKPRSSAVADVRLRSTTKATRQSGGTRQSGVYVEVTRTGNKKGKMVSRARGRDAKASKARSGEIAGRSDGEGESDGEREVGGDGENGGMGGAYDLPQPKRVKPRPVPVRKQTESGKGVDTGGRMGVYEEDVVRPTGNGRYRVCPICNERPYHAPDVCPIVISGNDAINFRLVELEAAEFTDPDVIAMLRALRASTGDSEPERSGSGRNEVEEKSDDQVGNRDGEKGGKGKAREDSFQLDDTIGGPITPPLNHEDPVHLDDNIFGEVDAPPSDIQPSHLDATEGTKTATASDWNVANRLPLGRTTTTHHVPTSANNVHEDRRSHTPVRITEPRNDLPASPSPNSQQIREPVPDTENQRPTRTLLNPPLRPSTPGPSNSASTTDPPLADIMTRPQQNLPRTKDPKTMQAFLAFLAMSVAAGQLPNATTSSSITPVLPPSIPDQHPPISEPSHASAQTNVPMLTSRTSVPLSKQPKAHPVVAGPSAPSSEETPASVERKRIAENDGNDPVWLRDLNHFLREGPGFTRGSLRNGEKRLSGDPDMPVGKIEGDDWERAVKALTKIERMMGFPSRDAKQHKLLTDGRPEEYQRWFKRRRQYREKPDIAWVTQFAYGLRDWYLMLQPSWRCDGDLPWPPNRTRSKGEINWGGMAKGGLNGFSLVLVGMVWWKIYLDVDPANEEQSEPESGEWEQDTRPEFESFVEELRWVLEEIVGDIQVYGVTEVMESSKTAKEEGKVTRAKTAKEGNVARATTAKEEGNVARGKSVGGRKRDVLDNEIVDGPRKRRKPMRPDGTS